MRTLFGRLRSHLPVLLLLTTSSVQAGDSLPELVESALKNNPGGALASAHTGLANALRSRSDKLLADAPTANLRYQNDRIGSDLGYQEWEGGVELPLWLPGQSQSFAQEAESTLELANAIAQARRMEVAGEVRERLWAAAIARANAEQAQAGRDTARDLADDVQRRVAAGELPRSDRLLAEKVLLQRDQALQQALGRATQADVLLQRYTGNSQVQQAQPEVAVEHLEPQDALQTHPQLVLAAAGVKRARAHRDRISRTAQSGPSLWLGAKRARATRGSAYESSVGVEISVPLGEAAYRSPELAEAEAALSQAQLEHARLNRQLDDSLSQAQIQLERQREILTQGERRRELGEQSLRLSQRAFQLGETDLVRLLKAQEDALSARYDHQLNQLRLGLAVARFNQALGVMPQ